MQMPATARDGLAEGLGKLTFSEGKNAGRTNPAGGKPFPPANQKLHTEKDIGLPIRG